MPPSLVVEDHEGVPVKQPKEPRGRGEWRAAAHVSDLVPHSMHGVDHHPIAMIQHPSPTAPDGRDGKGRFTPGNKLAKGNPHAKRAPSQGVVTTSLFA